MAKKQMVTTAETADMLGLSERRVQYLVQHGLIRGTKEGRSWNIEKTSVKEYIKQQERIARQKAKKGAR